MVWDPEVVVACVAIHVGCNVWLITLFIAVLYL